MANVTDAAFRRVIAECGKPDVMWTEFVSADGLFRGNYDILVKDLLFDEIERPIVAQIFSSDPYYMAKASELAYKLGFDGLDINMGCPDTAVCKQGSGANLISTPQKAKELILAAKKASPLPVSVKTRSGISKDSLEEWLPHLFETNPEVITLHARTKKDMSKIPARWELLKQAVELRNKHNPSILILGNGDVESIEDANKKIAESKCDGAMLGRAIFGNPWLFNKTLKKEEVAVKDRLKVLIRHTELFDELLGDIKSFALMKKHFKSYLSGIENSKPLLLSLMDSGNKEEAVELINRFLDSERII